MRIDLLKRFFASILPTMALTLLPSQAMDNYIHPETEERALLNGQALMERFADLRLQRIHQRNSTQQKSQEIGHEMYADACGEFLKNYEIFKQKENAIRVTDPMGLYFYQLLCNNYQDLITSNNLGVNNNPFDDLFLNIFLHFSTEMQQILLSQSNMPMSQGFNPQFPGHGHAAPRIFVIKSPSQIPISRDHINRQVNEFATQLLTLSNSLRDLNLSLHQGKMLQPDYQVSLDLLCEETNSLFDTQNFKELNLSNCNMTDAGAELISLVLKRNKTLRSLNLSHNSLTDVGGQYLLDGLHPNQTLMELNIDGNKITQGIGKKIEGMITCTRRLNKPFIGTINFASQPSK